MPDLAERTEAVTAASIAPQLFQSYRMRGITARNRLVVAPMWQYRGRDGFPTDWHLVHLGRFAIGGAGIVMQEGTSVSATNKGTSVDIGIWDDAHIEPYRRITDFIRENGAVPAIQLMHAGRKARLKVPWEGRGPLERTPEIADWDSWEVVGATDVPHAPGYSVPRALTTSDIAKIVRDFGEAARRSDAAGYDLIELHAGHGYLLHEFLSATSNTRTDEYGGGIEGRSRLLREVVESVRANWPADKPLWVRLSAQDGVGWTIDDSVALAEQLAPLGVDAIDCSSGGMGVHAGSPLEPGPGVRLHPGYQVPLAAAVRSRAGVPTVAVGLVVNAAQAEDIVASGAADLVAIGRELLMNPNWPILAREELESAGDFALAPFNHSYYLSGRERSMTALAKPLGTRGLAG